MRYSNSRKSNVAERETERGGKEKVNEYQGSKTRLGWGFVEEAGFEI